MAKIITFPELASPNVCDHLILTARVTDGADVTDREIPLTRSELLDPPSVDELREAMRVIARASVRTASPRTRAAIRTALGLVTISLGGSS